MFARWLIGVLVVWPLLAHADDERVQTTLDFSFYRCMRPQNVTCIAFDEEKKAACPQCSEWTQVDIYKLINTTLSDERYVGQGKHANKFVRAVLTDVYGLPAVQTARYVPAKMSYLYDRPEKYGWVKLPYPTDGALMVDRRKAALVTGERVAGGPSDRGPLTPRRLFRKPSLVWELLHPSSRRGGRLRHSLARFFFSNPEVDGEPISVLPDFMMYGAPPQGAQGLDTGEIPFGWNGWFEKPPSPTYQPSQTLRPNETYNFIVHLAPYAYRNQYGVTARRQVVDRLMLLTRSPVKQLRLKALLITDEGYLRPTGSNTTTFEINLEAIKRWQAAPSAPAGDPMEELRAGRDAPFVFGSAMMQVRTGSREGATTLALSLWDPDGWPIDEFVVPVCIAEIDARGEEPCKRTRRVRNSFGGADLARIARDAQPDAAFHFVDLGADGITGIFRRNDVAGAPYHVWKIRKTAREFVDHLSAVMGDFSNAAENPEELTRNGERVYNALFGTEGSAPRVAFEEFARARMKNTPTSVQAPALFVRFVEGSSVRHTRLLPLGAAKIPKHRDGFLGYYFRIETPLARQITDAANRCVSEWTILVPPASDTVLGPLRRGLAARLPRFLSPPARVHDTIKTFRDWITSEEQSPAAALLVVGHHDARNGIGRLRLDSRSTTKDFVASDELHREFTEPSVAILASCGSGGVGTEAFVNALNERGVDAIIATRHDVSTPLVIDFLDCLNACLPDNTSSTGTPLSAAHFDALQCVRRRTSPATRKPYGAAALAYVLVGNSSLRLCRPGQ